VPYVSQILEETLRLWPTAPAFTRHSYEDTVIGDHYRIAKETSMVVLIPMLHRDKQVWGENAEAFEPDRFSPQNRSKIPPSAYLPFGTGATGLHRPSIRLARGRPRAEHAPAAVRVH
jgi:cytochrome P450/NADPH-cytochrome P450 reductase